MNNNRCSLGIDLGTGSVKAALLDGTGARLGVASAPVELSRPRPGWVESDPEDWWGAVKSAVQDVLSQTDAAVGAVGLSGQMHGVVLARSDGALLRPAILWLDRRAEGSLDAYRRLPAGSLAVLGNPLNPGMAGPMLYWLCSNEAGRPGRGRLGSTAQGLAPPAAGRSRRAASRVMRRGRCFSTCPEIFGPGPSSTGSAWPRRLLAPLSASGSVAGSLDASVAQELGLPAGLPVAFGAADTAAALVGTGLSETGAVQLTVGSAAQVVALRRSPSPDPGLRYHVFASALTDQWYALAAVQAAGVALSWALAALDATWEEAYELFEGRRSGPTGCCSYRTWLGPAPRR